MPSCFETASNGSKSHLATTDLGNGLGIDWLNRVISSFLYRTELLARHLSETFQRGTEKKLTRDCKGCARSIMRHSVTSQADESS